MYLQNWTAVQLDGSVEGSFSGTWGGESSFSSRWHRAPGSKDWVFHHSLHTSKDYPWLMLYHRADSVRGGNGGYPWDARGMLLKPSSDAPAMVTVAPDSGVGPLGGPHPSALHRPLHHAVEAKMHVTLNVTFCDSKYVLSVLAPPSIHYSS